MPWVGSVDDVHEKWSEPTPNGPAFRNPLYADASDATDATDATDANEHGCGDGNGHGNGHGLRDGHGGYGCNWLRPRGDASNVLYGSSTTQ